MSYSSTTVNINERDVRGRTALYRAAERGDAVEVERLLLAGAAPNLTEGFTNFTALHVASTLEVVRLLVDLGADIEALDYRCRTPLPLHCTRGRTSCVELLCFKGANVKHRDNLGWTPVIDAVSSSERDIVELLSSFDADIDVKTNDGYTPLFQAVRYTQPDCVRLLLSLNADTTKDADDGWPVSQTDDDNIKQLLLEHSKKSEKERQELRLETMARIKHKVGIRLMRYAQPEIIGICLAMSSLELPPYVLLWIVDWLPNYDRLSHHKKIQLIESVRNSIWKIKM